MTNDHPLPGAGGLTVALTVKAFGAAVKNNRKARKHLSLSTFITPA